MAKNILNSNFSEEELLYRITPGHCIYEGMEGSSSSFSEINDEGEDFFESHKQSRGGVV